MSQETQVTLSEWTMFRVSIVEVADRCFGCKVPVVQAISKPAGGQVMMDTFKLKESNQTFWTVGLITYQKPKQSSCNPIDMPSGEKAGGLKTPWWQGPGDTATLSLSWINGGGWTDGFYLYIFILYILFYIIYLNFAMWNNVSKDLLDS